MPTYRIQGTVFFTGRRTVDLEIESDTEDGAARKFSEMDHDFDYHDIDIDDVEINSIELLDEEEREDVYRCPSTPDMFSTLGGRTDAE